MSAFGDGIKSMADGFQDRAKAMAGKVTDKVKEKGSELAQKGKDKGSEIMSNMLENKKIFQGKIGKMGKDMSDGAKSMGGKGLKAIKGAPAKLMQGAMRFVSLLSKIPMMLAAIPALLASPIVLIGLAVLALAVGLIIIWMKFKDQIMEKFTMMKAKVIGVVTSLVEGFLEVWQKVKDWFGDKVHGIKSFLGLTTEEEDAEHEKKKLKKKQKKEAMNLKEEEIEKQMKEKFGDKALNFFGGSDEAKEEKKRLMEEASGNYDENLRLDNSSSTDLLSERDDKQEQSDAAQNQLDAREKAVELAMKNNDIVLNGKKLEGEEKRAVLEKRADEGKLDNKRAVFEGASNEQLKNFASTQAGNADKVQAELETREDYIPANNKGEARLAELNEEEVFGGITEKEELEMNRLERGQGDRIKDSGDRAKEAAEQISAQVLTNQNNSTSVSNTSVSEVPRVQNNDTTFNRTAVPVNT